MLIRRLILWLLTVSNSKKIFFVLFIIIANITVPMVIATNDIVINSLYYNWLFISLWLIGRAISKYNTILLQYKTLNFLDEVTEKLFKQGHLNREYLLRSYLGNKNSYLLLTENIILASKNPKIEWKTTSRILKGTVVASREIQKINIDGIVRPTDLEIKSAIPKVIRIHSLLDGFVILIILFGIGTMLNLFKFNIITPGFMLSSTFMLLLMSLVLNLHYSMNVIKEIPDKKVKASWDKLNKISMFNTTLITLLIKHDEDPTIFNAMHKLVDPLPESLRESIFIQHILQLIDKEQNNEITT